MADKRVVKTVRFTQEEIYKIENFISSNSYFDFSTVIRMAVNKFLDNSEVTLTNQVIDRKSKLTKKPSQLRH